MFFHFQTSNAKPPRFAATFRPRPQLRTSLKVPTDAKSAPFDGQGTPLQGNWSKTNLIDAISPALRGETTGRSSSIMGQTLGGSPPVGWPSRSHSCAIEFRPFWPKSKLYLLTLLLNRAHYGGFVPSLPFAGHLKHFGRTYRDIRKTIQNKKTINEYHLKSQCLKQIEETHHHHP